MSDRFAELLAERVAEAESAARPGEAYRWHEGEAVSADPAAHPSVVGEARTRTLTETRFPCGQCGASLNFAVGTQSLECPYCGHLNAIARGSGVIEELDLHEALARLQDADHVSPESRVISCPNCAASFALDAHIHSGECPFCGTNVVTATAESRPIKPKGLLPFSVTADQARESYKRWLKGLWFAPSKLKEYARDDASLNGVYIPYWTYDSDTATRYRGERGDVYFVTQRYTTTVNGRRVTRTRQVPKIRWSPASGRTSRHFDDVLVGATRTLPRKITDWLAPWDLENLVPYREDYLSGFSSEVYQVNLDEGFNQAQQLMDTVIRRDVKRAIGGDQQRIHGLQTQHSDTTFKHVLLPLWSAAFQFRDETYRFVVNGRTGKVRGERPWSVVKIALAVLLALAILVPVVLVATAAQRGGGGFANGMSVPDVMRRIEPRRTNWPQVPLDDLLDQIERTVPTVRF